jgi:vacuolar protein sorting-associated protein 72
MAEEMEAATASDLEVIDDSSSENDTDESDDVETLVAGRSKRATAGNRLANILEKEADDDLELLFAEAEDDVEFEGLEDDGSDAELESSSEEEDQGPGAKGEDEFEGEKELQKRDRAEKLAKKRKAHDMFAGLHKKVKIDPTTSSQSPNTPAPRPKKKSERVSWLPTPEDGPVRQSSRRQTVQNKEATLAKLEKDDERRKHTQKVMEAAAKRKEMHKPKLMTQAERLAEAAKTERLNSKSLNRWEEMEKKRTEDQRAKLAALQNRKLEGPVVTFWSGAAKWVGDKLTQVGLRPVTQDADKEGRGRKKKDRDSIMLDHPKKSKDKNPPDELGTSTKEDASVPSQVEPMNLEQTTSTNTQQITFIPPQGPSNFLDGIQYHAPMPSDSQGVPDLASNPPAPNAPSDIPTHIHEDSTTSAPAVELEPQHSARNLVVLENFDPKAIQERAEYNIFFTKQKAHKVPSSKAQSNFASFLQTLASSTNDYLEPSQELCVITSYPAKYRDPGTGLPYFDKYGYGQIQKLKAGHCSWSNMLGCYVGEVGIAARGVPDKFFAPFSAPPGNGPIY